MPLGSCTTTRCSNFISREAAPVEHQLDSTPASPLLSLCLDTLSFSHTHAFPLNMHFFLTGCSGGRERERRTDPITWRKRRRRQLFLELLELLSPPSLGREGGREGGRGRGGAAELPLAQTYWLTNVCLGGLRSCKFSFPKK